MIKEIITKAEGLIEIYIYNLPVIQVLMHLSIWSFEFGFMCSYCLFEVPWPWVSLVYVNEWSMNEFYPTVIFELTSWLIQSKLQMSLEWMLMILMRVDVDFYSCDLKLEVHWLRYSMHCSFIYSDWEFRHVYYMIYKCAWTFLCCGLRAMMIYLFM